MGLAMMKLFGDSPKPATREGTVTPTRLIPPGRLHACTGVYGRRQHFASKEISEIADYRSLDDKTIRNKRNPNQEERAYAGMQANEAVAKILAKYRDWAPPGRSPIIR
jgi:hypothetical protein